MARLATIAVLLLSLLAVASCRVLEAESAISDEQGQSNPADLTQEADAAEVILSSLPAPAVAEDEGAVWLAFHHRPCHRSHLWLARHHGLSLSHHRGTLSSPGEARVHPATPASVFRTDTELGHGEEYAVAHTEPELEAVAVAEPDPDSRLDTDGEKKPFHAKEYAVAHTEPELEAVAVAEPDPDSRPDTDGEKKPFHAKEYAVAHTEPELEAVAVAEPDPDSRPDTDGDQKPFHAKEQMARFFGHNLHHHHEHEEDKDDDHEQDTGEGTYMKLFGRFHHRHHLRHHHEHAEDDHEHEDKVDGINTKLFGRFHHHQHHAQDSDGEVEELARRLSQAIIRRSVSHGGHHHHHHHHGAAEGGVKKWFKGLMNRF